MTGAEVAGLKWIADFAKSVLSATASDRLKAKTSEAKARDLGFKLYEALAELETTSAAFVEALRAVATLSERQSGEANPYSFVPEVRELESQLRSVAAALNRVAARYRALDPQLEVAVPDVAQAIVDAGRSRALVITSAEEALDRLARGAIEGRRDITRVVNKAERAQQTIYEATESVRKFLATEFAFKESF